METASLTIVVPAFNEASRIGQTLRHLRDFASAGDHPCDLIVIDDGSTDGTADIVRRFSDPALSVRLITTPANRGKGHAVRAGLLAAAGELVLMCDADLSTPLDQFARLVPWLERGYDVVVGSRDQPDSCLDPPQPAPRRWAAWTFRAIRRRVLLPELRDTQCGFKLLRGEAARDIAARLTIDGWLFDCELLGLAERLGYRIREVGVVWRSVPHSRVRVLPEALRTLPELWAIRRRLAREFPTDIHRTGR